MTDFVRKTTTHDTATGGVSVTTTTISGEAIRVRARQSESAQFAAMGLTINETAVLLFIADDYTTDRPKPGDVVTWEDVEWTTKWVDPIAPDGVTIAARVGVSR